MKCLNYFSSAILGLACSAFIAAAETIPQPVPDLNPVVYEAQPLPLSAVRLTGGPLQHAQQLDAKYLLELEPDRMLYYLRLRAGLKPKTDGGYGGWDGAGRQLTGHIAGHYLSAISYMYTATGDPRFKERVDYMVNELKEVQDAQKDGYIGALMGNPPRAGGRGGRQGGTNAAAGSTTNTASVTSTNGATGTTNTATGGGRGRRGGPPPTAIDGKQLFEALTKGTIQSGGFDLNGMWSPWYVEHKIFAGLRDAYHYTGNRKALEVEIKFAGWVDSIVSKLTDAQDQKMLATEFGGMNEVLADLYHDTGDEHWLAVSDKFEHKAIIGPLAKDDDILGGKHGNTLIPKMIGELSRYVYTGNKVDGESADFFWEQVVNHHSYATGGHGHDEYFDPADQLNNHVDGRDDESCNVYNMLKMTREMFAIHPDVQCADFMERALFNHVLASIDPNDGRTCYMVPVGRGVTHEYQDMFESFTCCVGTGMENHALHGYGIYYESQDKAGKKLWVNFYTPSTADCKQEGVKLDLATTFPEGETASIKITTTKGSSQKFTLALRRPDWADAGFTVSVNGKPLQTLPKPDSYVEITRSWKSGDTVSLVLPKELHQEGLPDNPRRVALMWGPIVLAGDLGPERRGGGRGRGGATNDIQVFVSADKPVADWLKPLPEKPGEFETSGVVPKGKDVVFVPFYRLPERTYAVYWDTFTPAEWDKKSPEFAADQARLKKLETATVAYVQPGQMQAERDANMQASSPEDSSPEETMGHFGRRGTKWFSFDIAVDPAHPMTLICTYYNDEWRERTFDVLVNGQKVGNQDIKSRVEPKFFDVDYKLPPSLVEGKTNVTVSFEATGTNEIGAVYGLRMIRADAEK